MLTLTCGEIHLWLSFYEKIEQSRLIKCRELLSEEESAQEQRFIQSNDRLRYLVTRALVRTVLSRYSNLRARDWTFSPNKYGRPEISNARASDSQLSFNVSHTRSLIVLGVTHNRCLGVDVENVEAREVGTDIADRYFAPLEVADLHATPIQERRLKFLEYWTLKESYIKARGMGLSIPLTKFCFDCTKNGRVGLSIEPELQDAAERWQFWQFRTESKYLIAVCVERRNVETFNLVVRRIVPTAREDVLEPLLWRTS